MAMKLKTGFLTIRIPDPSRGYRNKRLSIPLRWVPEIKSWVLTPAAHRKIEEAKKAFC